MKKIIFRILAILVLVMLVLFINLKILMNRASKITEGDPIPVYQTENPALLIVDLQVSTTGESSPFEYYKKNSEGLIREVNLVAELSDQQSIPVIYIRNVVKNPLVNLLNNTMAEGSIGSQLDERLIIVSDFQVIKDREDAFWNPRLDSILLQKKISRIYFVGLDASYCVNSTLKGAQTRDYKVSVLSDLLLAESDEIKSTMLEEYTERGIQIISSEEYIENLTGSSEEQNNE